MTQVGLKYVITKFLLDVSSMKAQPFFFFFANDVNIASKLILQKREHLLRSQQMSPEAWGNKYAFACLSSFLVSKHILFFNHLITKIENNYKKPNDIENNLILALPFKTYQYSNPKMLPLWSVLYYKCGSDAKTITCTDTTAKAINISNTWSGRLQNRGKFGLLISVKSCTNQAAGHMISLGLSPPPQQGAL